MVKKTWFVIHADDHKVDGFIEALLVPDDPCSCALTSQLFEGIREGYF